MGEMKLTGVEEVDALIQSGTKGFVIGVETEAGDEVADAEQYDAIAELGRDVGVEVELGSFTQSIEKAIP